MIFSWCFVAGLSVAKSSRSGCIRPALGSAGWTREIQPRSAADCQVKSRRFAHGYVYAHGSVYAHVSVWCLPQLLSGCGHTNFLSSLSYVDCGWFWYKCIIQVGSWWASGTLGNRLWAPLTFVCEFVSNPQLLIENETKLKRNWSEAAQSRFWSMFNWIVFENERDLLWGSPEQTLIESCSIKELAFLVHSQVFYARNAKYCKCIKKNPKTNS